MSRLRNARDEWKFSFIVTAQKDADIAYVGSDWNEGISPYEFGTGYDISEADALLRGTVFSDRGVYKLGEKGFDIFRDYNRRNMQRIPLDAEFMVIHDPQPAAFIDMKREGANQHWIWRCHIDLSRPDQNVWNFLEPYVNRYEGSIFSSPPAKRWR